MATPTTNTAAPVTLGRYEVSEHQFNESLKDEPRENILPFDLKTAFPDVLAKTNKPTKLVDKIWRKTLDEFMSDYGGAYYPANNSTFVQIWVDNLPGPAAKAKLVSVAQKMSIVYKSVHDKENPEEALSNWFNKPKEKEENKPAQQLSPEMARLIQEGLGENPTLNMLDIWMNRTGPAMIHGGNKAPFVTEIFSVLSKANISYVPMWNAQAELLVGSTPVYRGTVPPAKYTPAESFRQDLLILFSGGFQLHALATKNIQSLVFIPIKYQTLLNRNVMEFIKTFLRLLNPALRKSMIIELRGLPNDGMSPTARTSLQDMAPFCKAFMLETNIFSKEDFTRDVPNVHACGVDMAGLGDMEVTLGLRKFAENSKGRPQKLFVRGLQTKQAIKIAKDMGFSYLSGPAVHPAEKFCTAVRKHHIDFDDQ